MSRKQWIGHACWALVAAAAFMLGSSRKDSSEEKGSESSKSKADSRRMSSWRGAADGSPGTGRSPGRNGVGGGKSVLEGLFPVKTVATTEAQLEALAIQALQDGSPVKRRLAFSNLLQSMTPENAESIRALLVGRADGGQWRDFNYAWGAMSGAEAFEFARNSEEPDMEHVMTGWAAANPNEVMSLLANLPQELARSREMLEGALVAGVADTDRNLATDIVMDFAAQGNERASRYLNIVAGEMIRAGGVEDASAWSESLPDGPLKGSAMDQIANAYVNRDPEAAAAWAAQFADQEYAARVIEEVGDEWAERSPAEAVNWLESLPAGSGQTSGLYSAFGEWAERDAVAAGTYLNDMPLSPQRDAAVSGFVREHARRDPSTAIAWADSISDPNMRERALTSAGRALFYRDPEAARAWLAESGLPPEAQQRVTAPRRR